MSQLTGNPVEVISGAKVERPRYFPTAQGPELSLALLHLSAKGEARKRVRHVGWRYPYDLKIHPLSDLWGTLPYLQSLGFLVERPDGSTLTLGPDFRAPPWAMLKIERTTGGWLLHDFRQGTLEVYEDWLDHARLKAIWRWDGRPLHMDHRTDGSLEVKDAFQRSLLADANRTRFVKELDRLDTLANGERTTHLENATGGRSYVFSEGNLTRIDDENDVMLAEYQYCASGRVRREVNRARSMDLTFTCDEGTTLYQTDGSGHQWRYSFSSGDKAAVTKLSQPAGSGCASSQMETTVKSSGLPVSALDFRGYRSCFDHDEDRWLKTAEVQGLAASTSCTDVLSGALPLPEGSRKISTRWHPLWKLESRRAEPKRITTTVYNGQPDPIRGDGATVICAPDAPALPDGSPIAVVCRRYEQSTADESGSQGFDAVPLQTRLRTYTYNRHGQVLTETDPRGQASGRQTVYTYWSDTQFPDDLAGHWLGDLKSVTNPLGHRTEYLDYNQRGQPLSIRHPNGSLELREYHARGWPKALTLRPADAPEDSRDQITRFDHYSTGLLQQVTAPDGSVTRYTWDDAHRLTDVEDSAGNRVHYVLDPAGHRLREEATDPDGALVRTITRTFDALGRMSSRTGLPQ